MNRNFFKSMREFGLIVAMIILFAIVLLLIRYIYAQGIFGPISDWLNNLLGM